MLSDSRNFSLIGAMCMRVDSRSLASNEKEMIPASASIIFVGGLIGISCARAVPSSSIVEVSLGVGALLLFVYFVRREKGRCRREDEHLVDSGSSGANNIITSPDAEGIGSGCEERAVPPSPPGAPSGGILRGSSSPESGALPREEPPRRSPGESPPTENYAPMRVRVEHEMRRVSLTGREEPVGPKATAHYLRFRDTDGRTIRYTLRSSKKTTSATYLELLVEENRRKVRSIVYDDASHVILCGKHEFLIPSSDVAIVMKGLCLLCKIASVKLDCVNMNGPSPGLRRVMSNLDFRNGSARREPSSSSLTGLPRQ